MRSPTLLAGVIGALALAGCPAQPGLEEPCDYQPGTGNCFDEQRTFDFSDARVDAMDLAALPMPAGPCRDPVRGRVVRVVDGDTMDVEIDGGTPGVPERIRLIGVDTPETYVSMGFPHCYGPDAKLFSEDLTGLRVALSFDRGCDDGNGRVLAYMWLGPGENDLWQRQLLRRGYARTLTVAPNDLLETTFIPDEAIARAESRGQWDACQ